MPRSLTGLLFPLAVKKMPEGFPSCSKKRKRKRKNNMTGHRHIREYGYQEKDTE